MKIEDLKAVLNDNKLHVGLGMVKRLHLAEDRSNLKVTLEVFPELREIVAEMTWENVGPDSGDFEFPSPGDMCLFCQAEGEEEYAFVVKRLTSEEDKIPEEATTGDKVNRARATRKYWNISDTAIYLARQGSEPTENLVLGQIFKTLMQNTLTSLKDHAQTDSEHRHIGNFGYWTSKPDQELVYLQRKTEYDSYKTSPVDDEAVLSDLSYTEK